jgi:hypothetical protein
MRGWLGGILARLQEAGIFPARTRDRIGAAMTQIRGSSRFRSRREAERALAEIIEDGGHPSEFRIDEHPDGGCVIIVLEADGMAVAGTLGA